MGARHFEQALVEGVRGAGKPREARNSSVAARPYSQSVTSAVPQPCKYTGSGSSLRNARTTTPAPSGAVMR